MVILKVFLESFKMIIFEKKSDIIVIKLLGFFALIYVYSFAKFYNHLLDTYILIIMLLIIFFASA